MTENTTCAGAAIAEWLTIRKKGGLQINPDTAELIWTYAQTMDPYGVYPDLPEEYRQVGREYFARAPGSDVWALFDDLPETTRDALWLKHKTHLAFPAGLNAFDPELVTSESRRGRI